MSKIKMFNSETDMTLIVVIKFWYTNYPSIITVNISFIKHTIQSNYL